MINRDEFEQIYKGVHTGQRLDRDATGCYVNISAQVAWEFWQAACSQNLVVLDGWTLAPIEPTKRMKEAAISEVRTGLLPTPANIYKVMIEAATASPMTKEIDSDR